MRCEITGGMIPISMVPVAPCRMKCHDSFGTLAYSIDRVDSDPDDIVCACTSTLHQRSPESEGTIVSPPHEIYRYIRWYREGVDDPSDTTVMMMYDTDPKRLRASQLSARYFVILLL